MHLTATLVRVLTMLIIQAVLHTLMVDGPTGGEEATGIRIQVVVVEEGCRIITGDKDQITIDIGLAG